MPATQEITEILIRDNIVRAMSDVFKTMLSRVIKLAETAKQGGSGWPPMPPTSPEQATPQVVGTVGFLGDANGLIYLYFDAPFANECTQQILGMSAAELEDGGDEFVNDAVGELTNMIVGSFKNGLCDAGYPCKLTIPSILRGRNFCIEPISSAQRHIFTFDADGHRVVADILMNNED